MFGTRVTAEEGRVYHKTWRAWLKQSEPQYPQDMSTGMSENNDTIFVRDGQLVLAPKHDSVPFIPGRRMLVPIDPITLEPLNEEERRLGHPAWSGPVGDTANTTVVYIPPRFKSRVSAFLFVMWVSGSLFFCSITIVPVAVGRYVFSEWFLAKNNVHDVYAYLVGGSLMLLAGLLFGGLCDFLMGIWRDPRISTLYNQIHQFGTWLMPRLSKYFQCGLEGLRV
ncbi:E3 ubiquitin-protein ligase march7 [Apophysomyces ossiformis]|uniref:RING-type E3 ubiquitin transferase n=1 Tax=Apophysomyces ossiformis TaxID=679940 RepID=A0A8H7BLR9_9FUNG|nr:E3 ubiquitin-protein ligase march7 [Apophysomyces ossiformis]